MIKAFLVFAAAALLVAASSGPAAAQDVRRFLDARLVPAEGRALADFAPSGWKIEERAEGDLNRDGLTDAALRLIEDLPVERDGVWVERFRALVVLFAKPGGGYGRAAVATKLVYCSTCAGMLGDPEGGNISLEIKNGVLNVMQLSGSREATDLTQRFRFEPSSRRFALVGQDVDTYDRLNGERASESINYLTGVKVTKKTKILREGQRPRTVSNRRTRVRVARRFIEEIDYER